MKTYKSFINQTEQWPLPEFSLKDGQLYFHDLQLSALIKKYGTPLKINYLPKISHNIDRAKKWFEDAIKKNNYAGDYIYSYCTKSNHFQFVIEKALSCGTHLEISSANDISIIKVLNSVGKLDKSIFIFCNGFKQTEYLAGIIDLINNNYQCMPILDNPEEWGYYEKNCSNEYSFGIRKMINEAPGSPYRSSRLGISTKQIMALVKRYLRTKKKGTLKLLHFFISSGMRDNPYFWKELNKLIDTYIDIYRQTETLEFINIGGGLPIKSSIDFEFNYSVLIDKIVKLIKLKCITASIPCPNIVTEFGSFTVGETGALLYSILNERLQNKYEDWYMIDGSFLTHIPDACGLNEKYILLPINGWDRPLKKVSLGGLTCDSQDFYNSDNHSAELLLPTLEDKSLHVGIFHTGAYQEAIGGYGGIQHCLIPSPKHLIIDEDENGHRFEYVFNGQESSDHMLHILGY